MESSIKTGNEETRLNGQCTVFQNSLILGHQTMANKKTTNSGVSGEASKQMSAAKHVSKAISVGQAKV